MIGKCFVCGKDAKVCNQCLAKKLRERNMDFVDKVIDLIRKMPNADDRYNKLCKGAVPKMLDGGSVHRFTLIKEIEKLKKEGKKSGLVF